MQAIITWWSSVRQFGFAERKIAVDGGWRLERFYLHQSEIIFQAVTPESGCTVVFDTAASPSNRTEKDRYPCAVNIKVYASAGQAALAGAAGVDGEAVRP